MPNSNAAHNTQCNKKAFLNTFEHVWWQLIWVECLGLEKVPIWVGLLTNGLVAT